LDFKSPIHILGHYPAAFYRPLVLENLRLYKKSPTLVVLLNQI
jgi:hypothetical protein